MDKKVAFITGGSRGIGKEIARKFAENGYNIVVNYVSDKTDVAKLQNELSQNGNVEILCVKGDVTDFSKCEEMVRSVVEKFGRIDVLVNNAGITKDNLLMRMKEEDFDRVIDVNLKGTFNMTKNVISYMMKQRNGRIVNISSVVGVSGNAGQTNYAASKAGIIGFTKSVAKELASRNILANAVAPGFIETDMTDVLSDTVKESINSQIPLRKMGNAKEVANAVYFLGAEENTYITGQVLNVDGRNNYVDRWRLFYMNYDEIKKLMDDMGEAKIDEINIEFPDGLKISMKKNETIVKEVVNDLKQSTPNININTAVGEEIKNVQNDCSKEEYKLVKSPMVGTFYGRPSPKADMFVKVGDKVKKGDILCIVEAMKLMNEIESEFDGEVAEILVKDEEMVEYGQVLIKIK